MSGCALLLLFTASTPQAPAATPGGVTLTTPFEGSSVNAPGAETFNWTGSSPAASWYHLWIGKDGAAYQSKWLQTNTYTALDGLPGGNYTWYVQTWNSSGYGPWSGPATFTVNGNYPSAVTLVSPIDDAVETNGTINYTWSQDASSTWYNIYIMKDGKLFKNIWSGPTNYTTANNQVTVAVPGHSSGNYSWWVHPWGPDGFGDWSSRGSFNVQANGEPGVVTLVSPADGATAPTMTTLFWNETDPVASWYYVYVNKDGGLFKTQWVQTNSYTFPNGLPGGNYTWWVRPWNSGGYGRWSSPSSFYVVGGVPTNTFAVAPVGDVTLTNADVSYIWTDDPSATWYQLYVDQNNQMFLNRWFNANDVSFINGNQRVVTITGEPSGNYTWWLRGWSPDGYSEWTSGSYTITSP